MREIASRDLNPRAASFGKTFTSLNRPADQIFALRKLKKGNQDPIRRVLFNSIFRRRLLKRAESWILRKRRISLVYAVLPRKDWPALLRLPGILLVRKFGDDWHLNTALHVFACCERFCSCEFVSRVRRLLFPLTPRLEVFAPMST